jgi:hypothetical protein
MPPSCKLFQKLAGAIPCTVIIAEVIISRPPAMNSRAVARRISVFVLMILRPTLRDG